MSLRWCRAAGRTRAASILQCRLLRPSFGPWLAQLACPLAAAHRRRQLDESRAKVLLGQLLQVRVHDAAALKVAVRKVGHNLTRRGAGGGAGPSSGASHMGCLNHAGAALRMQDAGKRWQAVGCATRNAPLRGTPACRKRAHLFRLRDHFKEVSLCDLLVAACGRPREACQPLRVEAAGFQAAWHTCRHAAQMCRHRSEPTKPASKQASRTAALHSSRTVALALHHRPLLRLPLQRRQPLRVQALQVRVVQQVVDVHLLVGAGRRCRALRRQQLLQAGNQAAAAPGGRRRRRRRRRRRGRAAGLLQPQPRSPSAVAAARYRAATPIAPACSPRRPWPLPAPWRSCASGPCAWRSPRRPWLPRSARGGPMEAGDRAT